MNCRHCNTRMGWVAGNLVCINQACTINTPTTTSGTTGDKDKELLNWLESLGHVEALNPNDFCWSSADGTLRDAIAAARKGTK